MPPFDTLLGFTAATLVLLVIPGPAVMYIVTRSAAQGRRAGLVSVAGIHTGTIVHNPKTAILDLVAGTTYLGLGALTALGGNRAGST